MKVTVTGGAGFIGANLCRALIGSGLEVCVLDDLSTGHRENLVGLSLEFHEGSVLDRAAVERACDGSASVIHLAAISSVPRSLQEPIRTHIVNETGTVNVLEVARANGQQVVLASTAAVYGNGGGPGSTPAPESPYASSKLGAELHAATWQRAYGVRVATFRFFNVYGPWQRPGHAYASVIPAFVTAALAGHPLRIFGDGEQTRNFIYVDTLCQVLTRTAVEQLATPEPVDLAGAGSISVNDLVAALERALGRPLTREHLPVRAGDVLHSRAESRRLAELLPGVAEVGLDAGLTRTVDWFRALPGAEVSSGNPPVEASTAAMSADLAAPQGLAPVPR